MLAPPADLDIAVLSAALAAGWGIRDPALDYLTVGFGSHHWRVTDRGRGQWFVTVDEHRDPSSIDELRRAFGTASALHRDAGLAFILAPVPEVDGDVIRVFGSGAFTVAVTPWIDGSPLGDGRYTSTKDRALVLGMLGRLHAATPRLGGLAPPSIDLALPDRAGLMAGLADLDRPWNSGAFGEPTRALVSSDASRLAQALTRYDDLVKTVTLERQPWVVTHGEPHTANLLRGTDGAIHLIDWDTAQLAPRERDLSGVMDASTDLRPYLEEAGDVPVSAAAVRLFRLRWDLGEIALYVSQFHAPHDDDPNTRESWKNLGEDLPVSEELLGPV